MNIKHAFRKIKPMAKAGLLKLKDKAPDILVVGGSIGVGVGTVLACKATLKAEDILDKAKEQQDKIEEAKKVSVEKGIPYTDEDIKKDRMKVKMQTGLKLAKLYWLPTTILVASLVGINLGYKKVKDKKTYLAGAYAVLNNEFNKYRDRVAEELGKEKEELLFYNCDPQIDSEKIAGSGFSENNLVSNYKTPNQFAQFFTDGCIGFSNGNPRANKLFLLEQECYLQRRLEYEHFLPINDICKALGLRYIEDGYDWGYLWDPENPAMQMRVSLGLQSALNARFMNGEEAVAFLTFDGGDELSRPIYIKPSILKYARM